MEKIRSQLTMGYLIYTTDAGYIANLVNLGNTIAIIIGAVFVPLGLIFNFLSMYVFSKKRFKHENLGFINQSLISFQTLSVIFGLFIDFMLDSAGVTFATHTTAGCVIVNWLRCVFDQVASWIQVFLTVDTFLHVRYTKKFALFSHRDWLLGLLISFSLAVLVLN